MTQKLIKEQITFKFSFVCPVSHHPILFANSDLELKNDFINTFKLTFNEFKNEFSYLKHDFLRWSFLNKTPICFDYQPYTLMTFDEQVYDFEELVSLNLTIEILNGSFNSIVEKHITELVVNKIHEFSNKYGSQIKFIKSEKYRKYEFSEDGFRN